MKRTTVCWAAAGIAFILCTLLAVGYGTTHEAVVLLRHETVEAAAEQVLNCAASGDYETLETLLAGNATLGVPPAQDDTAQGLIWKAYQDSIKYHFRGLCAPVGAQMAQDVRITCLDIPALMDALEQTAPNLLETMAAQAADASELYEEDQQYREEFLSKVMAEAAKQVLAENSQTMEREITLCFARQDGSWRVVPDESLLRLLSGFLSD